MAASALPVLIQAMLTKDFYPHPVSEPLQVIQTHISYVVLTGTYAYKVKKPVNFGFLDFSSLGKRQQFCQAELCLNQRTAPELYLEVLPISQGEKGFRLGDDTQPIEYTLKMRQFPQEALLLNQFHQGKVTEQLMEELGKTVAQFHAKTQTSAYICEFGQIAQIRAAIAENYEQTRADIGGVQTLEQFQATKDYTDRFFARYQDLFLRRMQQQKIRACHGDLHLQNICYWQNKLLLFDCIEFNEAFRFVDVMYDVAFVVMDLEARDRPDLANAFLNTYVEQTGDWEGLQVLPLYLCRQAYVRAKVNSFLTKDPEISEEAHQQATQTAAHYYQLAWRYTQSHQGGLMIMCGLSGSGKSTAARYLARRLGAIHLRSDAIRKHLGGISVWEKGAPDLYSTEMTHKTYAKLLELGTVLASQGFWVILDAKYDRQSLRKQAIEAAHLEQLPLKVLHCSAPMSVLQARVKHRQGDITDATPEVLASQFLEPFAPDEQPYVKTLDTTGQLAAQLESVVLEVCAFPFSP